MRRNLVFLFALLLGSPAFAAPDFVAGLGGELRFQKEVNPDYVESKVPFQVFGQMQFANWAAQLEAAFENQQSKTGGIIVTSRSISLSAWGRYTFLEGRRWRPFAGLGIGNYFDQVTSRFNDVSSENNGQRLWAGAGGGIRVTFWRHLYLDGEQRFNFVQERKEPMISVLLRIGFLF